MAIFHWHMQVIRRGDARSAVAAAAYRSGTALIDARTALTHDFRRRRGVAHAEIVLPAGADPAFADRARLWNLAEAAERRRDAVVAREAVAALPHELPQEAQIALLVAHARHIAERLGVAVDVALHLPGERRSRRALAAAGLPGGDPRNAHGHLLWTTRRVAGPDAGKKTRELDDRKTGSGIVEALRADWEARVNSALKDAAIAAQVDRRSRAARGDAGAPAPKLGPAAAALEARGVATERGTAWRAVRDGNAALAEVQRVIDALKAQRETVEQQRTKLWQGSGEMEMLQMRRRALEREIRPVAPPLDIEAALDRVSRGEHRRLREATASARERERRAGERAAALRWWQVIPRWRAQQERAGCTAQRIRAEEALAECIDARTESAAQMVRESRQRHDRDAAEQRQIRRALLAIKRALDFAQCRRRALWVGLHTMTGHADAPERQRDRVR